MCPQTIAAESLMTELKEDDWRKSDRAQSDRIDLNVSHYCSTIHDYVADGYESYPCQQRSIRR